MSKISKAPDGRLVVPDVATIPFITGDGVGAEITPAMQKTVDAALQAAYGGQAAVELGTVPAALLAQLFGRGSAVAQLHIH